MNIKKLDWNEYHSYIDKLAIKINMTSDMQYQYIAGVRPDDMIVAVHLSHKLKTPSAITDINILCMLTSFIDDYDRVLLVSNIVETGHTFVEIINQIKSPLDTGVLFVDKNSKYKPTFYVERPESRIYFPWEQCGI